MAVKPPKDASRFVACVPHSVALKEQLESTSFFSNSGGWYPRVISNGEKPVAEEVSELLVDLSECIPPKGDSFQSVPPKVMF